MKAVRWEDGLNRIADLKLLRAIGAPMTLVDEWERYTVKFSIYYPLKPNEVMRINGDLPELGGWNKGEGPVNMTQGQEVIWLTGAKVRPWEYLVRQK